MKTAPATGTMPGMQRVLVVEDDAAFRAGVTATLALAGHGTHDVALARAALAALRGGGFDLMLVDLRLPDLDGLALLDQARAIDAELPVVLMSGQADIDAAVQALKRGAHDFIEKPFSRDRLLTTVARALQQRALVQENRRLRDGIACGAGLAAVLVGDSAAMREARTLLLQVAASPVDVLVLGETGTGKELAARALHDFSGRRGPFVAINCAALPEALMESELFGHERGAFTGAASSRIGRIEHASGGTLFLDEIEAMPASLQAKLLRALQEREVSRLGSNRSIPVDLRVVAAGNAELAPMIESGRFRADLFYRLNTVTLRLAPLRERVDDVLPLFRHLVQAAALRLQRQPAPVSAALAERLLAHGWPGNARELRSAAERHVLGLPALPGADDGHGEGDGHGATTPTLAQTLQRVEQQVIADALQRHGGAVEAAAQELGLSVATLYRRLRRHRGAAASG